MMDSSSSAVLSSLANTEIRRGSNNGEQGSRSAFAQTWSKEGGFMGNFGWLKAMGQTAGLCHADLGRFRPGLSRGLEEGARVED